VLDEPTGFDDPPPAGAVALRHDLVSLPGLHLTAAAGDEVEAAWVERPERLVGEQERADPLRPGLLAEGGRRRRMGALEAALSVIGGGRSSTRLRSPLESPGPSTPSEISLRSTPAPITRTSPSTTTTKA
jgi:hypothetical protein